MTAIPKELLSLGQGESHCPKKQSESPSKKIAPVADGANKTVFVYKSLPHTLTIHTYCMCRLHPKLSCYLKFNVIIFLLVSKYNFFKFFQRNEG